MALDQSVQDSDTFAATTIPTSKRVSYVLPPCRHPPQFFSLPEIGADRAARTGPVLLPSKSGRLGTSSSSFRSSSFSSLSSTPSPDHPQHTLAVSSLAIDTTTCIASETDTNQVPPGILYTGGRDGLVGAWQLNLPMKNSASHRHTSSYDWNNVQSPTMSPENDGHVALETASQPAYNAHWQVDPFLANQTPPTQFRQCVQSHTDWVNDMILCNQNQTLISASSDRTVKIWNPHDPQHSLSPQVLGTHKDFIKALAYAKEAAYVASSGFDRRIKLWDVQETRHLPMLELGEKSIKTSVYSLSVNPSGSVIAGGSPERHVKVWDPRAGQKCVELVGHTDNVRTVLVSQDGRHLLSGSSDSTIRLWSLGEQRCLHTFTHHSDSVWSLFSNHPDLDVFYSGDRQGYVCKVDWERCAEVSEGECVVLCRERGEPHHDTRDDGQDQNGMAQSAYHHRSDARVGIQKIVALDDTFFWTATGSSSVNRWRDVPPRTTRQALYPLSASFGRSSDHLGRKSYNSLHYDHVADNQSTTSELGLLQDYNSSPQPARFASPKSPHHSRTQRASGKSHSLSYTGSRGSLNGPSIAISAGMDLPPQGTDPSVTMYGVPFDSLVSLAPINDPYGDQIGLGSISMRDPRGHDDSMLTSGGLRSFSGRISVDQNSMSSPKAQSIAIPIHPQLANLQAMDSHRPSSTHSASLRFASVDQTFHASGVAHSWQSSLDEVDEQEDPVFQARLAFENRELAQEAQPLRASADQVIKGSHGLIRSSMLNDRRHVIAISSTGAVTLWDVIRGICIGQFEPDDVRKAAVESSLVPESMRARWRPELTPGDILEVVKERIEGQGATPLWCSTDTKSGALTVHLEESRCFEAEFYFDEFPDCVDMDRFKDDQRGQVARWILRNLFADFIQAEQDMRGEPSPSDDCVKPDQQVASVSISGASSKRRKPLTSGMTIGLATQAKTRAIQPPGAAPLTTPSQRRLPSLSQENGNGSSDGVDASLRKGTTSAAATIPLTRPGFKSKESVLPNETVVENVSTGTGGLMSKFRFGKNKSEKAETVLVESTTDAAVKTKETTTMANGSKEETIVTHTSLVEQLLSNPICPPSMQDCPSLGLAPDMTILLSESSADAGSFEVIYRGLVNRTGDDLKVLEETAPLWLLECILFNRIYPREPGKLSFTLQPWIESDGFGGFQKHLQELPSGNTRLTATRCLRIKKACSYVCEHLDLSTVTDNNIIDRHPPPSSETETESIIPPIIAAATTTTKDSSHQTIEILCNQIVLPIDMTLAQCQRFIWRSTGDIQLEYRLKNNSST